MWCVTKWLPNSQNVAGCISISQYDYTLTGFTGQYGYSQSDDTFWKVPMIFKEENWRLYNNLPVPRIHGQSNPETLISPFVFSITASFLKGKMETL